MSMRRHHAGVLTVLALALGAVTPVSPAAAEPSDVLPPAAPAAPVATVAPRITGQVAVGHTLEVSDGHWDVADVTYSYQWLSDGVPVPGAVYGAFDLRRADVGKRISAVVTASAPERPTGSAGDTSRRVAPAATTTKVIVPQRTRAGRTVRLRVQVTAYKLAPRGAVRVTYGGRVVAKRLRLRGGQAGVTLPRRRRAGRFGVTAVYLPADAFRPSTGRAKVRVRR
jgi:hypothetical protein